MIPKALALVLAYATWNGLSDVLYQHLQLDSASRSDSRRIGMILLGTLIIGGGVLWLGCVVWARQSLHSLGWRAPHPVHLVGLGLLLTALSLLAVFTFVAVRGGMDQVRGLADAIRQMPASDRVFFTIMGAKVAFAEETLFRGLLLPALARKTGTIAAVVLSSVVFGLYHRLVFPLPILFMKVLLGSFLAVFTVASRSLLPAWIAHSLLWAIAGDN